MLMPRLLIVAVAVVAIAVDALAADTEGEVARAIRSEAPIAAAIGPGDFRKLAESPETRPDMLENQPLALLFLTIPVREKMSEAEVAELDYGPTTPKPSDLATAFKPDFLALLITPLQPNYIKSITAVVEADTATGEIAFEAAKVYKGKLAYTAKKLDGKWKIVEFRFPARKLKTSLDAAGNWKMGELK